MHNFTKISFSLSILLACGPTPGMETTTTGTTDDSSTSTVDPTTSGTTSTGNTSTTDPTTGTTGEPEPFCSPSALCETDDDCPASAHCSAAGVCATECDPTCSEECMTADPPCPAPCDKQCATGCTANGECLFCDVGSDTTGDMPPVNVSFCTITFCNDFESVAIKSGIAAPLASALASECAANRCQACDAVSDFCETHPCAPDILEKCALEMETCECPNVPKATCCELYGELSGGLCGASSDTLCVDCDGKPALCRSECEPTGEPCCLSITGETVACSKL